MTLQPEGASLKDIQETINNYIQDIKNTQKNWINIELLTTPKLKNMKCQQYILMKTNTVLSTQNMMAFLFCIVNLPRTWYL